MANKLYEEEDIRRTADAIRQMNGLTDKYDVSEFEGAILGLSSGGGALLSRSNGISAPKSQESLLQM